MKEEKICLLEKEISTTTEKKIKKIVIEKKEKEILKKQFSSTPDEKTLEKPNYDKIEELPLEKRKKIFKLNKRKEESDKNYKINKKLKIALVGIALCLLTAFCITTGIEIAKTTSSIEQVQSGYDASLGKLIQKIYSTETGNRSLDLFETFPEEDLSASSFYEKSNWFDRFCSFLAGFFGG